MFGSDRAAAIDNARMPYRRGPPCQSLKMLTALDPFHNLEAGQRRLADTLNGARMGNRFSHPALSRLDSAHANSPALFFDLDTIAQRMQWLRETARPFSSTPLVAVKSCPGPEYLALAHEHLQGYDVSNQAEYAALPRNLGGKLVSVTSPVLSGDLNDFVAKGNSALVTLDSHVQLNHYFGQGAPIPYSLRIQGSDLLKSSEPADVAFYPETRFGFSLGELDTILKDPRVRANPPAGFHVHHGSERNQVSTYKTFIRRVSQLARQLPHPLKFVNLGGGWHNLNEAGIREVLQEARNQFPLPGSILFEPGRWYADNAGFAVGTILNQTQSGNIVRYTLDLSGKSHLHWSQAKLLQPIQASAIRACQVQFCGPSCYEADFIGQYLVPYRDNFFQESGLVPGSRVVFTGISTYSAAWNTTFNGIPCADVAWLKA